MASLLNGLRRVDEALTGSFDDAFAPALNPWRHLGALAFLNLVVLLVSGLVAYALYDTSVQGAYASGLRLQKDPYLLGRILRGLHRYAADGFLVLSVLHLLREAARGHFLGVRWYSWITGVPLLWLLWGSGLTGFWLLWDARALYSITATAEWLQALPMLSGQLVRNFLTASALNDRLFSLIVFMHIGLPLLLLAGIWVHVQRLSQVRIWPPRVLTVGTLVMLVVLSLLVPAQSLGPADTGHVDATLSLDWFYLFVTPMVDATSAQSVWLLALGGTALLTAMPWLPKIFGRPHQQAGGAAAQVDLANCNGCARCVADCPFGAVTMVARTDGLHHQSQASVDTDLCAACGICVGSCPSSTPFRHIEDIVSGIELPGLPIARLREQLQTKLAALVGPQKVVLFTCRQAADWQCLEDASTAVVALECAAMLPPSFTEYAVRLGADGVLIAGCREADCEYRLGDRWLQERLAGQREPRLRAAAPRERIQFVWAGGQRGLVEQQLVALRTHIQAHAPMPSTSADAAKPRRSSTIASAMPTPPNDTNHD
jgi:ferredoxin/coenzyme F420-reducing hydrogenase delta subunit